MTSIFDDQFYPTPPKVAAMMLQGLNLDGYAKVYDPHAGLGHLLNAAREASTKDRYGYDDYRPRITTYAGELKPDFQAALREQGHEVVAGDIYDTPPNIHFDYILANPPFRQGVAHLLRIYDVLARGAEIRCLLNAESVRWALDETVEPKNRDEERLAVILRDNQGTVQSLGRCFTRSNGAERPADVEVALVILKEQGREPGFHLNFDPEQAEYGPVNLEAYTSQELAQSGVFQGLEGQFSAALGAFAEVLEAMAKCEYYLDNMQVLSEYTLKAALKDPQAHGPAGLFVSFHDRLLEKAWNMLFSKTKMAGLVTRQVKEHLQKRMGQQAKMAFTAKNMQALFLELALSQTDLMTECVLSAFDEITGHTWQNRNGLPGFKSNSDYQVQKRFIMSYVAERIWGSAGMVKIKWDGREKIDDIERALCFLSGHKFEEIKKISDHYEHGLPAGEAVETTFFKVRVYENGNAHFWWLDPELRVRFNQMVAEVRGYQMPETVKTGAYK